MKNRKSLKRLEIVYGFFMAAGVLLCVGLIPISNAIPGADPETAQIATEEKAKEQEEAAMKDTVMGDVYDINGKTLVSTDPENHMPQYRDDKAYSNVIGFYIPELGSHLLMGNFGKDLYYADGDTDKGRNLTLTLDADVQESAYKLINSGSGEKGSITVLNAKTGAVVAMAFNPSFSITEMIEKNRTQEVKDWRELVLDGNESLISPLLAPTRPGSIYKLVTSIGILEQGFENTVISDDGNGVWEKDGVRIQNSQKAAYGALTYRDAFVKSSNIYFGRMAYEYLGWETFHDISARCKMGINQKYDFGTVVSTYKSDLQPFDESQANEDLAKAAYGYSTLQLTGMQAAMITQGIANQGIMCSPYMLEAVHKTSGYEIGENVYRYVQGEQVESVSSWSYEKGSRTQITTSHVADKIKDAMLAVYEERWHNSTLEGVSEAGLTVDGVTYPVALKTGTADIKDGDDDYNNIWMVSFAPATDPQYVVVVNRYGVRGEYGANLFDDVMKVYQVLFGENNG